MLVFLVDVFVAGFRTDVGEVEGQCILHIDIP